MTRKNEMTLLPVRWFFAVLTASKALISAQYFAFVFLIRKSSCLLNALMNCVVPVRIDIYLANWLPPTVILLAQLSVFAVEPIRLWLKFWFLKTCFGFRMLLPLNVYRLLLYFWLAMLTLQNVYRMLTYFLFRKWSQLTLVLQLPLCCVFPLLSHGFQQLLTLL
jgi:hypothetical protein